jgi:hypothetical protein
MVTYRRLFIIGVTLFTASFLMPIGDKQLGYNLALIVFEMSYHQMGAEEALNIFLLSITNVAALTILFSYYKFHSIFIAVLGFVGTLIAFYWMFILVFDNSLRILPFATIGWSVGILLLTVSYEMKRRRSKALSR